MIQGGKGGANTNLTGLAFEKKHSLEDALKRAGFEVEKFVISKDGKILGELAGQYRLYKFLTARDVEWSESISKRLKPDEALYSIKSKKLTIVEKKFQTVNGSVDEKLQTSAFKLKQYRKLVEGLGIEVQYVYLLSDYFSNPRYQDVLDYIKESGADYHFESLPLELLDL
jgi:hypothetical protein